MSHLPKHCCLSRTKNEGSNGEEEKRSKSQGNKTKSPNSYPESKYEEEMGKSDHLCRKTIHTVSGASKHGPRSSST